MDVEVREGTVMAIDKRNRESMPVKKKKYCTGNTLRKMAEGNLSHVEKY